MGIIYSMYCQKSTLSTKNSISSKTIFQKMKRVLTYSEINKTEKIYGSKTALE